MTTQLFFGGGVGRCGTMALANLLNSEVDTLCLHEGKMRLRERAGEKLLPFLTLQNSAAYARPDQALELFKKARSNMYEVAHAKRARFFGDVAYNYAPFFTAISEIFPEARIFVIFRDGRDFVQSATTNSDVDEAPVGWAPNGKALSHVEQFIAMGRWRPRPGERWSADWTENFDHFEKNAWLWAETNRVILDALPLIDPGRLMILRFENFFSNLADSYSELRQFLGMTHPLPERTAALIAEKPINRRVDRIIGKPESWSKHMHLKFDDIAGQTMCQLGYKY